MVEEYESVALGELLSALTSAVVELVDAPAGVGVQVGSVAFLDPDDLSVDAPPTRPLPALSLQVGVADAEAAQWLRMVAEQCPPEYRPRAVLSKGARVSTRLRAAAAAAGVALVAVNPQARWETVHAIVNRILDAAAGPRRSDQAGDDALLADTDLFGLAQTVAGSTGGLVTIEDDRSHVLAYSADSDEAADPLRRLSVLGRQGPPVYLRRLHEWGVFDRLRTSDDAVEVPAHEEMGTRRRIAIAIREPGRLGGHSRRVLGTIWVQEAHVPLAAESGDVLRGAAAIAARIIWRTRTAPTEDGLLIQRLFGGDVDVRSFATDFGVPEQGPAAVVGFAHEQPAGGADPAETALRRDALRRDVVTLRLHASVFRADGLTTVIGDRAYVLFPQYHSATGVASWTRQVIGRLENQSGLPLRAAIAAPVAGLADVARARTEVDRVLDRTVTLTNADKVTDLARSRTAVLLGETLTLLASRPELRDPRLGKLLDYDTKYSAQLRESLATYLEHPGDVRTAATRLQVHPNTLRYRVRRAADIMGLDLDHAPDRLLIELQLAVHQHAAH
ncbi:helix-turn-helix domain-containing protein [Nocardia uniformis]|uniref:Helix-turn-helix domain-containing protein n=1 Tax=Nocardia uniformis TaxID=53432 RepID=A0A849C0Q0_9NOCA|nr:PucR family transcriptional regulator [Nocardia uniformis]NNH72343.1 helix-turn-helix domain-containing protein [Nocardia uniformis]